MYDFEWHLKSRAYKLLTRTGSFVASEIRPVYAQELLLLGADKFLDFDPNENKPILWGKHNSYIYKGEEIAKFVRGENGEYAIVLQGEKTRQSVNRKRQDKERKQSPNVSDNTCY